ncbi:MAG: arginine--tRNA ligase [Verrucomicrobiota bacterium]
MLHGFIEQRLREAVSAVLPGVKAELIQVRPCPDAKFGDYQANSLIALARESRLNPRQLAADVVAKLNVGEWCEKTEIAGPGFINFRLKTEAVAEVLHRAACREHLFFDRTKCPRTIIVDFSSPNVAKPMHVGHIRSTILGDCLARTLRLLGHRVITDNHIGDWGTQFGKLLVGWKRQLDRAALQKEPLAEMERLYKTVNAASERNPAILDEARQELVKLQQGDPENLGLWGEMIAFSQKEFNAVYRRLGVQFDNTLGESFYGPRLKGVVQQLLESGLARESDGAIAVFFDDIPELKSQPALIQKSDGAANYTTTDLATLAYRMETWQPDEIIYVTDGRQQLHFQQLFAIFGRWHPGARVKLVHVWFGMILGKDGKPFKTRTGENIKLSDLLDEAEERAFRVVSEKNPDLADSERRDIARVVGLGAIKYSDLLPNRQSDYVFDWDKMLSLAGNTAPYLQYAYTRIRSIFRKAQESGGAAESSDGPGSEPYILLAPEEIVLSKHLLNFGLVLEAVVEDYRPNYLCKYLYELAGHFAGFYENCPVLKSSGQAKATRLSLCDLTGRVLKLGLEVLGIATTEKM